MIDVRAEKLIPIAESRDIFPGRPSLCAIWRWRTKGIGGRKLESVAVGGRVFTSVEAIARFARSASGDDVLAVVTPAKRQREVARAKRDLKNAGI